MPMMSAGCQLTGPKPLVKTQSTTSSRLNAGISARATGLDDLNSRTASDPPAA